MEVRIHLLFLDGRRLCGRGAQTFVNDKSLETLIVNVSTTQTHLVTCRDCIETALLGYIDNEKREENK